MERITSRRNALVERFRKAVRGHGPETPLLLDGVHLVSTALDCSIPVDVVAVDASALERGTGEIPELVERLRARRVRVVAAAATVLEALSPVRTPSGLVALAKRPAVRPQVLLTPPPALLMVAVGVQDPGNLGAIVRAADAAGATGVVATSGSADPFGWKALRGSMGSALRLPIWAGVSIDELRHYLEAHDIRTIATVTSGGSAFDTVDLRRPAALIVGSEGHGLPAELLDWAAERVHVPMRSGVESLNVAVTAALLLYEARRQGQERGARRKEEGGSKKRGEGSEKLKDGRARSPAFARSG